MDLEGLTRRLMSKGYTDKEILDKLVVGYHDHKDIDDETAFKFANAVLEECKKVTTTIMWMPDCGVNVDAEFGDKLSHCDFVFTSTHFPSFISLSPHIIFIYLNICYLI